MNKKHNFEYKRTSKEMNCFMVSLWIVYTIEVVKTVVLYYPEIQLDKSDDCTEWVDLD